MAVEASHLNYLRPSHHLLPNRRFTSTMNGSSTVASADMYPAASIYEVPMMPGLAGAGERVLLQPYASAVASRKRPRVDDSIDPLASAFAPGAVNQNGDASAVSSSSLGEAVSVHILQQHSEIDRFITQHMEKVRAALEERRRRNVRRMLAAVEESTARLMRAKEEEIERMGKLNWALAERVRSLSVENQVWKDMSHANEATVNVLRATLHQALISTRRRDDDATAEEIADDAESCCAGSCPHPDQGRGVLAKEAPHVNRSDDAAAGRAGGGEGQRRWCRNCGEEPPCVLLLPCRHLCLCTVCGSSLHTCPVCHVHMDASVQVNMS